MALTVINMEIKTIHLFVSSHSFHNVSTEGLANYQSQQKGVPNLFWCTTAELFGGIGSRSFKHKGLLNAKQDFTYRANKEYVCYFRKHLFWLVKCTIAKNWQTAELYHG